MSDTKNRILDAAHALFNQKGVGEVSTRQIAIVAKMSHGNLNYHFKNKQEIISALHDRLLATAHEENARLSAAPMTLASLYQSTLSGLKTVYHYRFFMVDLNHIVRQDKVLHHTILQVEQLRSMWYRNLISNCIKEGLMRKEDFEGEFENLVDHIRIFSDYWVSSAQIYLSKMPKKALIEKNVVSLMALMYPYLTEKGKAEYLSVVNK